MCHGGLFAIDPVVCILIIFPQMIRVHKFCMTLGERGAQTYRLFASAELFLLLGMQFNSFSIYVYFWNMLFDRHLFNHFS